MKLGREWHYCVSNDISQLLNQGLDSNFIMVSSNNLSNYYDATNTGTTSLLHFTCIEHRSIIKSYYMHSVKIRNWMIVQSVAVDNHR